MTSIPLNPPAHARTRPLLRNLKGAASMALGLLFGLLVAGMVMAVLATTLFGYQVVRVSSGSMAPALGVGDIVVVRPQAISDVKEGDMALFSSGEQGIPTVHRVVGINEVRLLLLKPGTDIVEGEQIEHRLVTKGDANPNIDAGEVTGDELHGTVWFTIPAAGGMSNLPLQTFLLIFAGMIGLAWLSWELYRRAGKREAEPTIGANPDGEV